MAVTIVVLSADSDPLPSITFDAPRVVLGRGDGADVRLPDPSVSHRHASLRQRGSDYLIVDEGSTNGTYVGGVRLAPQSPRIVRDGDVVRVGRIELQIRVEHGAPITQGPLATRELALGLVSAALAAQGEALVVRVRTVTRGGTDQDHAAELELPELGREYVLGRGRGCDLVLPDADCSRRHLGITRRGDGLFVRDLGSKNGSRLDGRELTPEQETPWKPDTSLHIGDTVLTYEDPLAGVLEELERAADEPVTGRPPAEAAPGIDAADDPDPDPAPRAGTVEGVPRQTSIAPRRRRPLDPGLTDFLVGTLAVLVLASSLVGLYWLLSS